MRLELLAPAELPALQEFFDRMQLHIPPDNLAQFCVPRAVEGGIELAVLVAREGGTIIGSVSWIDVPLRLNDDLGLARPFTGPDGRPGRLRWPINLYLLADQRGKGLGRQLLEATRDGAAARALIGGTTDSIRVFDKTGFSNVASLVCARWARPCPDPSRIRERIGGESRKPPFGGRGTSSWRHGNYIVRVRRARSRGEWLPWADSMGRGAPGEAGVPREAAYLRFAFDGAMAPYHLTYFVDVNGALSGYFVLAARRGQRFRLYAEVVDLDAVPGREGEVLEAARRTGLSCADVVRARVAGDRFTRVLSRMTRAVTQDHALRVAFADPGTTMPAGWRMTYGDQDQYRVRGASQRWRSSQA